jgi:flagellar basal-body rod protein FlgB
LFDLVAPLTYQRAISPMLNSLFGSSTIPALEETARFSQTRHEVLVGNIANYGVPGYKTRDLSTGAFQQRLREAIDDKGRSLAADGSMRVFTSAQDGGMSAVHKDIDGMLFHDGSNVGMEQQVLEVTKNQNLHNLAVSILTHQFSLLQAAVSERV